MGFRQENHGPNGRCHDRHLQPRGTICQAACIALIRGTLPARRACLYLVDAGDCLLGEFHLSFALSSKHRDAPPSDLYLGVLDLSECYFELVVLREMRNCRALPLSHRQPT